MWVFFFRSEENLSLRVMLSFPGGRNGIDIQGETELSGKRKRTDDEQETEATECVDVAVNGNGG